MNANLLNAQAAHLVSKAAFDVIDSEFEGDLSVESEWDAAAESLRLAEDALIVAARDAVSHLPCFAETLPAWNDALRFGRTRFQVLELASRLDASTCRPGT